MPAHSLIYTHLVGACEGRQAILAKLARSSESGVQLFLLWHMLPVAMGVTGDPRTSEMDRLCAEDIRALEPCLLDAAFAAILVCAAKVHIPGSHG